MKLNVTMDEYAKLKDLAANCADPSKIAGTDLNELVSPGGKAFNERKWSEGITTLFGEIPKDASNVEVLIVDNVFARWTE